jgi:hypothetical protein
MAISLFLSIGVDRPVLAAAKSPPLSSEALLLYAVDSTKSEFSTHFSAVSVDGAESTTLTADVSQLGVGQQAVVIHTATSTGHVNGRYVGGSVYFNGDEVGLQAYLGFTSALAQADAGKWVRFSPQVSGYSQLASAFTLQAAVAEVAISAPWTAAPSTTINGVRVLGVRGTWHSLTVSGKQGPAVLYVGAHGNHLPIRLSVQGPGAHPTSHGQVTFSKWNEHFSVSAPRGAVPYALGSG